MDPLNSTSTATDEEIRQLETDPPEPEKKDPPEPPEKKDPPPDGPTDAEDAEDEDSSTAKRDTELEAAQTDEERERIRAARRDRRQNRQQRQKTKLDTLTNENAALRQHLQQLEQTVTGIQQNTVNQQLATVDAEIARLTGIMRNAAAAEADAISKADGVTATRAREAVVMAREQAQQLQGLKQRAQQQLQQPAPLDPEMVRHAKAFQAKNNWFDARSKEPDSVVLSALDNAMVNEGWNPKTPAYWDELQNRVSRYLPHRVQKPEQAESPAGTPTPPRSPVAGSGNGASPPNSGQNNVVSAERVKAMKDAGIWDDPKRREAAILRYRKYDAENKANA